MSDLVRDLQIATAGARRALAICEKAVANVVEKTEALASSIGHNNEARAVAFAATGEVLLTGDDVAGVLRVSKATLARWRVLGTGPGYVKKQGRVLYRAETIQCFVSSKERTKTRDEVPA